jgi:uroporphyrinogen-III synthase
MGPWVITREAADAAPLLDALAARGVPAIAVPAIERNALPWPAELDAAATPGALVFCTSAYAAELAVDALGPRTSGLRFAATAPATARVLRDRDLDVVVEAQGGSAELARAVVAARVSDVVVYPTSDAGLQQPEQAEAVEILSSTCRVVRAPAYRTRPAPGFARTLGDVVDRATGRWRIVLFSPSAARALVDALAHVSRPPDVVVSVGASTARALPFPSTLAPRGADLIDFVCSLAASSPARSSPEVNR